MSMNSTPPRPDWGPTRAKQSAEAETNINNIVKRFTKTGQLTHVSEHLGQYRDMSEVPDLHEAMNVVADANSAFMELPAEVRKAVGHDVGNFLPWLDDPANAEQALEWGLLDPSSINVPNPPIVADPPATEPDPEP